MYQLVDNKHRYRRALEENSIRTSDFLYLLKYYFELIYLMSHRRATPLDTQWASNVPFGDLSRSSHTYVSPVLFGFL